MDHVADWTERLSAAQSVTPVQMLAIAAGSILVYFFVKFLQLGPYAKFKGLPPGPPTNVVLGTPNFRTDKPHIWWAELAKKYGPILSVWNGGTPYVVLSDPVDIQELCQKRGAIYSSRPAMHVFHDIMFRSLFIASCAHNEIWRRQRKIITSLIGARAAKDLVPNQNYESKQLMNDMVKDPNNFIHHTERFGTSILMATVFGYRADDLNHPSARSLVLIGGWIENKLSFNKWSEDAYPILQRVPNFLAWWRKKYFKDAKVVERMARAWWEPCKQRVRDGIEIPCFATRFAKCYEEEGWSDDDASVVSFGLLLAGAGTTGATISFFIMACCLFPETVKKAQEEIDRVIGKDRYPNLDDEADLPYVRAMIKECHRWRPISNFGVPHSSTKEDEYKGYRIPKGTTIVANAYAIHQDESRYPNPQEFIPERFIDYKMSAIDAANLKDANARDHYAYGAGRRICAGIHIAEVSLFLVCSRLLWGFNFGHASDKSGQDIPIDTMRYAGDMFGKPHPFKAKLKVRDAGREAFIKRAFQEAKSDIPSLTEAANNGDLNDMARLVEELEKDPEATMEA